MASYHITVTQVHPNGDMKIKGSKQIFTKECLTVGEANELLKAKKEEYNATPAGKIEFSVTREHY